MNLSQLIAAENNDSLALREYAHVYQVWEDGEITLQKCGSLLNQRILHSMEPGDASMSVSPAHFPHMKNDHAFAYVTEEGAQRIRHRILNPEHKQ